MAADVLCIFCRCVISGKKHNPYRCQQARAGNVPAMIQEAHALHQDAQEALAALKSVDGWMTPRDRRSEQREVPT